MDNNETNEIHVSGTIAENDIVQINDFFSRKIYFGVLLTGLVFILPPIRFLFDALPFGFYTLFIIISVLLSLLFLRFRIRQQARKLYKSDALAKLDRKVTISNLGITQKISNKSETHFEWTDIIKGVELNDVFILYVSNNNVIAIPKVFFKSTKEIHFFKKIANENLKVKFKRR